MLGAEVLHKAALHQPRVGARQSLQTQDRFHSELLPEEDFPSVLLPFNPDCSSLVLPVMQKAPSDLSRQLTEGISSHLNNFFFPLVTSFGVLGTKQGQ